MLRARLVSVETGLHQEDEDRGQLAQSGVARAQGKADGREGRQLGCFFFWGGGRGRDDNAATVL